MCRGRARVLKRAGYDVLSETNPRAAIEFLGHTRVDLLLVDIRMPEVDGFDVISRAKRSQPDVAVLVMTGFGTVETPMTETVRSDRFRERTLARIPLGRIATPAEVAPLICFLLSDASSFVTGQNWLEDGGSITHV